MFDASAISRVTPFLRQHQDTKTNITARWTQGWTVIKLIIMLYFQSENIIQNLSITFQKSMMKNTQKISNIIIFKLFRHSEVIKV